MHIKRYKGHRLPDVMRQVREDLGEEAVILHTKAGAPRGLRRLIGAANVEVVVERLAALIDVGDAVLPPRAATLAVVGPSGAGKTTVVAKLAVAAHVAALTPELLTLDGSTVGATTQLETLGRIIDAPCTVALTRRDVAAALDGPPSGPRLIDTPAVSVRDPDAVAALAELLRAAAPAAVHLVLPATATRDDLLAMVRAFAPLGATLARRGRRVMLLDGDLGLASLNVLLGMAPRHDLRHVLAGERRLDEILLRGPYGLRIIPAGSGVAELARLDHETRERLLATL